MRKILFTVSACFLLLAGSCITAYSEDNEKIKTSRITVEDGERIEDYLDLIYDVPLKEGESYVTREAIEEGIEIAKEMEKRSEMTRSSGEVWTVVSSEVVVPYRVLKSKYVGKLGVGMSQSYNFGINISAGVTISGFKISLGASWTRTATKTGPNGTEAVSSSKMATHRYFTSVASGAITRYQFRVTDRHSGNYLRTVYQNNITNRVLNDYAQFGNLNPTNGELAIRSASNSKVKHLQESNYITRVNTRADGYLLIYW